MSRVRRNNQTSWQLYFPVHLRDQWCVIERSWFETPRLQSLQTNRNKWGGGWWLVREYPRVCIQLIAASLKEHTNQMCRLELPAPVKQHETLIQCQNLTYRWASGKGTRQLPDIHLILVITGHKRKIYFQQWGF